MTSDSREFHVQAPRIRILYAERKNVGRWAFEDLRAPYFRLYHQGGPGAWVDFGAGRVPLHPDRLYLIPAQTAFSSGSDRPVDQFYIHFTLQPFASNLKTSPLIDLPLDDLSAEVLARLSRTARSVHQALLLESLVRLALLKHDGAWNVQEKSPRLERALRLMRHHLSDGIPNHDLAREVHMSEKGFVRWFREEAGCPPQKWLTRERVREAALRLHHTDAPLEEIAESLGFCDRYHFSRVFKKLQGTAPAAFRRNRERTSPP